MRAAHKVPVYSGQPMSAGPEGASLADVAARLLRRETVHVTLQPGDFSRYDFVIVPLDAITSADGSRRGLESWGDDARLLVVRLVGMRPVCAAVCWPGMWEGELSDLARGNEWSHELLAWWIDELFAAMEKAA